MAVRRLSIYQLNILARLLPNRVANKPLRKNKGDKMKLIVYNIGGQIKFYTEGSIIEYGAYKPVELGEIDLPIKESNRLDLQVMPLLIKDEISQKLVDRLNMFERQMASDYGFANKQKIAHKIKELKKCIQIVQSA